MTIDKIITTVISAYEQYGSRSAQFYVVYAKHENALNSHKRAVLIDALNKPVTLTGKLRRRGDGKEGNLNLVSPAYVNGVKVEHLHVYDEVIEAADVNKTTGMFIVEDCKVYRFGRNHRHADRAGLGIKPADAPKWHHRNEW